MFGQVSTFSSPQSILYDQVIPIFPCLYRDSSTLPALRIENLVYEKTCYGANGGVDVFWDPETSQRWCIKCWNNRDHGVNEIIASELLQVMGLKTPHAFVFENIPDYLKIKCTKKDAVLFRVSEYIVGEEPSFKEVQNILSPHFAKLAFLGLWDTKSNNLIVDQSGDFYYLDLGSALFFRALGSRKCENRETSPWSAYQVTELSSFSTHGSTLNHTLEISEQTRYVLRPDEQVFNTSLDEILSLKDQILYCADELCVKLRYSERSQMMEMLTARFQHYQMLKEIRQGILSRSTERFSLAGAFDAAGVLAWTKIEGIPHVLLGQRSTWHGTGSWVILGGSSDGGETFAEVAVREVFEESGGAIEFKALQLENVPAHDLITMGEDGDFRRFRSYVAQINYIEAESIISPEYSRYEWVSVEELLRASQSDEGVFRIRGKTENLFPSFKMSLTQKVVQNWLQHILKGTEGSIKNEVTQSIAQYPDCKTSFSDVRVETSYSRERRITQALAQGVFHQERFQKELAQRVFRLAFEINDRAQSRTDEKTPSYQMLNHLYPDTAFDVQIRKVIADAKNLDDIERVAHDDIELVKSILDVERQYPNDYFAYHGLKSEIWLVYRVLSYIRHALEGTRLQTDVLRSLQSCFDALADARSLQEFMLKGGLESDPQYHGMSFNPTLFGSLSQQNSKSWARGEATLRYFLSAYNIKEPGGGDIWQVFYRLFDILGLPQEELTQAIKQIYKEEFEDRQAKGALLQVSFDDKDLLDQATYVSGPYGYVLTSDDENLPTASGVIDAIKNGQTIKMKIVTKSPAIVYSIKEEIREPQYVQLRMHPDLPTIQERSEFSGKIRVRDYFTAEVDLNRVDGRIETLFSLYKAKILHRLLRDNEVYGQSPPKLQRVARSVLDIREFELNEKQSEIARAYAKQDWKSVLSLLLEAPENLEKEVFDPKILKPIMMKDTPIASSIMNLLRDHPEFIKETIPHIQFGMSDDFIAHLLIALSTFDSQQDRAKLIERAARFSLFKIDAYVNEGDFFRMIFKLDDQIFERVVEFTSFEVDGYNFYLLIGKIMLVQQNPYADLIFSSVKRFKNRNTSISELNAIFEKFCFIRSESEVLLNVDQLEQINSGHFK